MKKPIQILIVCLTLALMAGCTTFHPKPLSPSQTASAFKTRTLDNLDLKAFLEGNLQRELKPWPPTSRDFPMLTLAAFYYHPDLDVPCAQ
jgi:outer membrane protein, heavy metal efflux system